MPKVNWRRGNANAQLIRLLHVRISIMDRFILTVQGIQVQMRLGCRMQVKIRLMPK